MGALKVVRETIRPDTVERVEAEIGRLNGQAAELAAEIDRLALLEDDAEDPTEVGAAANATRAARNRYRKLEGKIAQAHERLAVAKAAARAKLQAQLLAEYRPVAREFLTKARAAHEVTGRLIAAREALQSVGFATEYRSLPIPPNVNGAALLAMDLLDVFEAALDPKQHLTIAPTAPAVTTSPALERTPEHHGPVRLNDARKRAHVVHRAVRREEPAEGERLFALHRGVLDHPRKGEMRAGDVVSLRLDEAEPLIRNGAGDFITVDELAEVDASDALVGRLAPKEEAQ